MWGRSTAYEELFGALAQAAVILSGHTSRNYSSPAPKRRGRHAEGSVTPFEETRLRTVWG
jgi:hypothetical protein